MSGPGAGPSRRADRLRAALWALACAALATLYLEGVLWKDEPLYVAWCALAALAAAPRRWPGAERVARRLLLLTFVGALGVSATDLIARGLVKLSYRPEDALARKYPPLPEVGRFAAGARFEGEVHGDLGAMQADEALRVRRRVRFVTDQRGFRNDLPGEPAPHDVVVLGDSFAFGSGTTQEDTWVQRLRTEHGRAPYSVAFPGSPWQSCVNAALALEDDLPLRPGGVLLLMLFSGNDLDDVTRDAFEPSALGWPAPWWRRGQVVLDSWRARSPVHQLRQRRKAKPSPERIIVGRGPDGHALLFYRPYVEAGARDREAVREHPGFASLVASIARARELAARHGLRPAVVCAPTKAEVLPAALAGHVPPFVGGAFAAEVAERCQAEGVPCLDLLPVLRARAGAPGATPLYWPDDTHWSAAGHAVAAEAIAALLDATQRRGE